MEHGLGFTRVGGRRAWSAVGKTGGSRGEQREQRQHRIGDESRPCTRTLAEWARRALPANGARALTQAVLKRKTRKGPSPLAGTQFGGRFAEG